jgi:FixJ family two-component response regulator
MNHAPCVFIVDDDEAVRNGICMIAETAGFVCQAYESAEHFLSDYTQDKPGCLILDVNLPGLNGPDLQQELIRRNIRLPIIFLTAHGDIPTTVRAMRNGAYDFLTKPVASNDLISRIGEAIGHDQNIQSNLQQEQLFLTRIALLSEREKEILPLAVAGLPNKEIAAQLGISHRTVEVHRISILKKTGSHNFVELARNYEAFRHLL